MRSMVEGALGQDPSPKRTLRRLRRHLPREVAGEDQPNAIALPQGEGEKQPTLLAWVG